MVCEASPKASAKSSVHAKKRVLILTSSGGGGHLQAAKVKEQDIKNMYPDAVVLKHDFLINWMGKWLGSSFATLWNNSQAKGNLLALGFFSFCQGFLDFILAPFVFAISFQILLREKIDVVIDTQPMGTSAIIKAIRFLKYWYNRNIRYEKIFTEFPTDDALDYLAPIKRLAKQDRKYITLVTTHPLLQDGEDEASFWERNIKTPLPNILYEPLPLRQTMKAYTASPINHSLCIDLSFGTRTARDTHIISKVCSYGHTPFTRKKDGLSFCIDPADRLTLCFMGTYPNTETLHTYIKSVIELKRENPCDQSDLFFIFCNSPIDQKCVLQEMLLNLLPKIDNYPENLTIIPLPYQEDDTLAPLISRADATITKSGGITSMEIFSLSKGKIWIHQDAPPALLPNWLKNTKYFKYGMPPWEGGNAAYLQQKRGASFITPESFKKNAKTFYATPKHLPVTA